MAQQLEAQPAFSAVDFDEDSSAFSSALSVMAQPLESQSAYSEVDFNDEASGPTSAELPSAALRSCSVFCRGPILDAVQRGKLFEDSKEFVDMPLKKDPEEVLAAFHQLGDPGERDPGALRAFVSEYFGEAGEELVPWTPPDFVDEPPKLSAIKDAAEREWAFGLNRLWKTLGRMQKPEVAAAPQRYSALPRRFGMVIPGGRFRETYYWDSYWIVRGLLVCDMVETARGLVENLLDDVRKFGFVPNGGRTYYLDRSQPPLLSEMVIAIDTVAHNTTWLKSVFPVLEQEYNFWMNPANGHTVSIPRKRAGDTIRLNIYNSSCAEPRPESYREDLHTAARASQQYQRRPQDVYRGLRAAAESGWDFSSRWFAPAEDVEYGIIGAANDIATVNASAIVPVDLNCLLYRTELNLASMQRLLTGFEGPYEAAAVRRRDDMTTLLWLDDSASGHGTFRDYRLDTGEHSQIISLSDFAAPLWAFGSRKRFSNDIVESLLSSGLLQPGGALTTAIRTGQQWDAPNAWPPLQLMLIEGLDRLDDTAFEWQRTKKMADDLASGWLQSNLKAWQDTGLMYEKYNAFRPGVGGGDGEYIPQVGFGWSNGVALALLERAKSNGNSDIQPLESGGNSDSD